MVFTPRQPLSSASVGLGSSSPRAVPLDAIVGGLSSVADGAVIGRIALAFPLLAAGIGAAWLVGRGRRLGALAASGLAVWNPYVVERLALGQWALLWAYAALPWVIGYATRVRRVGTGLAALLLWTAAASITPTGGLIAAVVGVVIALPGRGGDRRAGWWAAGGVVVLQLPWVVPSLVGSATVTSDPAGVAAFAARSEHAGGPLLSLAGTGGIWDAEVVPGSRDGPLAFVGLAVLVAAAVVGWPRLVQVLGRTSTLRLTACAVAGFVLAAAASVPGLSAVMRWAVRTVPGAGLLRDAQKWLMPYVVLVVLLGGAAVARLAVLAAWRVAVAAVALAGPLVLLPDAMRTLRPTMEPVHYPADWSWARHAVGHGGDLAVVPFQSYRRFAWAPGRTVLDPAPRLLPGDVVVSDRLAVSGRVLRGEDSRARAVAAALDAGEVAPTRLAAAGVGWVLVEQGTPGPVPDLRVLTLVRSGPDLTLYRVPGPIHDAQPSRARIVVVLGSDALAVILVLGAAGSVLLRGRQSLVRYRAPT
ncbi:MAG TPA: hypothetical protein VH373_10745 [Jatrophihabitantaceae bacterium]|jgi:hypothetical protein